jgi:hypothetical protein
LPTLLSYSLTFQFNRSVKWSGGKQVPQVMEVVVIPLASPSFPDLGTFVGGPQSQTVLLTNVTNDVVFQLVPTYAAGLSEPVLYRVEWREGGITGRTFTEQFAMPSQDVTWDEVQQLGNVVTGVDYIQQSQIGIPGGIAALNVDGEVTDATGTPVANSTDLATLTGLIDTEVANRQTALNALNSSLSTSLAEDINGLSATVAGNLNSAVGTLNATMTSNFDQLNNLITTEANTRTSQDSTMSSQISALQTSVSANTTAIANRATLTNGVLTSSQIPPILLLTAYQVSGQAGMLALSATAANGSQPAVHYADIAIWANGSAWMLLGDPANPQPSTLSNWQNLTSVVSVQGKRGDVTLTPADIGAIALNTGVVLQSQVQGLATTLNGYATTTALATLTTTVNGILNNTNIVYLDTSGPSSGFINHAKLDANVAYVNGLNEVTLKNGTVIASGTGSIADINGDTGPSVTLTAADVGAIALGASITEAQVTGLSTDLANRVLGTDSRLTNARTPTAHASTHAAAGSDPLSLSVSQVTGLSTTLAGLASETDMTNAQAAISTLQTNVTFLLGGGTPSSSPVKANWYDGTGTFTGITTLADFQNIKNVQLKGPWGQASDNTYYYNPGGANVNEWQYAYITPNGHLQLREWNESNPPDPAPAFASDIAAINTTIGTLASQAQLAAVQSQVNAKASQSAFNTLQTTVGTLATQASVNSLATAVGNAATQASLNAVSVVANAAASQSQVNTLSSTVATLATQVSVANLSTIVATLQTGQATKADLVNGTVPLNELPNVPISQVTGLTTQISNLAPLVSGTVPLTNLPSLPTSKITSLDSTLALKADLVGGLVPTSQLPSLSVNQVFTAVNRAAMLALSGVLVGDIAIITGTSDQGSYILGTTPASTFANWILMPAPANVVSSINGQSGAVTLTATNVGALPLSQAIPVSQVTNLSATLSTFATTTALTTAVTGLQSLSQIQSLLTQTTVNKQQANFVATAAVPSLAGQQSIDGVLTPLGSIVLVTAQPSSINNGLWVVNSGAWVRATDFASGTYFVRGTEVTVASGTTNANTFWQETAQSGVVDTNANNWTKIMTAGAPLVYTQGNGISINSQVITANVVSGGGLSAGPSGLTVDRATTPQMFKGFVPAGSTVVTITHGLNSTDVCAVFIKEMATGNQVLACPTITGPNTLTIEFANAPATNQWRVIVTA